MLIAGIAIICIGAVALLAGCRYKQGKSPEKSPESSEQLLQDAETGGLTDKTNENAPKEIKSDELIFFETEFFRNGDYVYDKDRIYRFKMTKSEDGVYTITEGYDENLKCETDVSFAVRLQQIIREYDLVSLNGIDKQTAGLPPEYGPYWVNAEYASEEKLYFFMDGDPNEAWTGAILDLFAKEFGDHGIADLLPPKEESAMTRFELEYSFGDVRYCYGEIWIPMTEEESERSLEDVMTNGANYDDCVKMAYAEAWDKKNNESLGDGRRADITEEYYQALQEIVEETELNRFQNGSIFPGSFDYENTPQYYEFYIEYESGKRMSAFTQDAEQCERFAAIAARFTEFLNTYFENN